MRRRVVARRRRVGLGFPEALTEACDLTRQPIDLVPLSGDGLVQRFDGVVLKHQAGFEPIDAVAERGELVCCLSLATVAP